MDAEIHIPNCVTVVFRCHHLLADDESTLAIIGSDKVLGQWNVRNPAYARRVGNDFWETHVYLHHGSTVWWKWVILNSFGTEKMRESIPDRWLQIQGDSLCVTAYWNEDMQVGKTWEGETRTCCPPPTDRGDPGKGFLQPPIVYVYPPPYGTRDMLTPREHWDMFKRCTKIGGKATKTPVRPPYTWVESENTKIAYLNRPTDSGLDSFLHQVQMAFCEERLSKCPVGSIEQQSKMMEGFPFKNGESVVKVNDNFKEEELATTGLESGEKDHITTSVDPVEIIHCDTPKVTNIFEDLLASEAVLDALDLNAANQLDSNVNCCPSHSVYLNEKQLTLQHDKMFPRDLLKNFAVLFVLTIVLQAFECPGLWCLLMFCLFPIIFSR